MTVFSCPTFVANTYLIGGFGTFFIFPMILGMSSSQLIHIFPEGLVVHPPTSYAAMCCGHGRVAASRRRNSGSGSEAPKIMESSGDCCYPLG
jgi:hypothetical protein